MTDPPETGSGFFTPEQETPDGWRLPLTGNMTSCLYFRKLELAFEVWLGGEQDVTVRLTRPFTYTRGDAPQEHDPRATQKSTLAPLINLSNLEVAEFEVGKEGRLGISFSDGSRLDAGPAGDGVGWILEWPFADTALVAARPGGGLDWPSRGEATPDGEPDAIAEGPPPLEPVRRGANMDLPIRGCVSEISVSGESIELIIPIATGGLFCVHFGGELHLVDAAATEWTGDGGAQDRTSLGRFLDFLGKCVAGAEVDDGDRLNLTFDDGPRLTAAADSWEAHWPMAGDTLDEHWVPREGPNIP